MWHTSVRLDDLSAQYRPLLAAAFAGGRPANFCDLGGGGDAQGVVDQVSSHNREIRRELGNKIRHQARVIPELRFFLDETLDYAEKINKLLEETKKNDSKDQGD